MDTPRTHSPAPVAPDRRRWLATSALLAGLPAWATRATAQPAPSPLTRPIPSSGEALPVVGLGSWITFNVGNDPVARDGCAEVVRAFFAEGGRLIDSSPMYGSSQPVIGHALAKLGHPATLFSAEKVWVGDAARGAGQMAASRAHWGVPRFDLMQVHNLLAWEEHLPRLQAMKAAGQLRYVGISTSEGRRHAELERILRTQAIDFVQLTYNLLDREVEQRLLPLAQERRIAVIVNRPFRQGDLLDLARPPAARLGARDRLRRLGPGGAEIRGVAPGRHLRHSRHQPGGASASEHGRGARTPARRHPARAHGAGRSGALNTHVLHGTATPSQP